MDEYKKLRDFNEIWDGRRLFTACAEFMFWYELAENVESGQGLPEVEKSYWVMTKTIQPRINYFSKSESTKRSKIKRDSFELFPHALRLTKANELGGINQVTFLQGNPDDKSDVFVDAHLTEFCYQRMGLTIEEVMASPQAFVDLCIRAIGAVKFKSGIAGISMNYEDVYINGSEHLTKPIVGRFKGVNVINPWRYRDLDGVPTVNWLTLVSSVDLQRLGGWDSIESRIKPPVTMHSLPHGALFQAGPAPLLGDVNAQEKLDAYYAVGALLAPVKSNTEVQSRVAGDRADTTVWMHRFFLPQSD